MLQMRLEPPEVSRSVGPILRLGEPTCGPFRRAGGGRPRLRLLLGLEEEQSYRTWSMSARIEYKIDTL